MRACLWKQNSFGEEVEECVIVGENDRAELLGSFGISFGWLGVWILVRLMW